MLHARGFDTDGEPFSAGYSGDGCYFIEAARQAGHISEDELPARLDIFENYTLNCVLISASLLRSTSQE